MKSPDARKFLFTHDLTRLDELTTTDENNGKRMFPVCVRRPMIWT